MTKLVKEFLGLVEEDVGSNPSASTEVKNPPIGGFFFMTYIFLLFFFFYKTAFVKIQDWDCYNLLTSYI